MAPAAGWIPARSISAFDQIVSPERHAGKTRRWSLRDDPIELGRGRCALPGVDESRGEAQPGDELVTYGQNALSLGVDDAAPAAGAIHGAPTVGVGRQGVDEVEDLRSETRSRPLLRRRREGVAKKREILGGALADVGSRQGADHHRGRDGREPSGGSRLALSHDGPESCDPLHPCRAALRAHGHPQPGGGHQHRVDRLLLPPIVLLGVGMPGGVHCCPSSVPRCVAIRSARAVDTGSRRMPPFAPMSSHVFARRDR